VATPSTATVDRALVIWLAGCCVLVFATIVLGAAVRLTGSGLSMVDWRPITGAIPPLGDAAWQQAFDAYKKFPEYQLVNRDMTLAGFKFIFWFEYAHRLSGRVIGVAFLLPFLFFLAAGRITGALGVRLWALFALGGVQGLIGWYMVQSGLTGAPHVSHYRLALHFMLAAVIYAWMLRVLVGIARRGDGDGDADATVTVTVTVGKLTVAVIFITLLSGALVAGTRAGFAYNTWPLMDGAWWPAHLFTLQPWWRNFTDNIAAIQFAHRWLAVVALAMSAAFAWRLIRDGCDGHGEGHGDGRGGHGDGGKGHGDSHGDGGNSHGDGRSNTRPATVAAVALFTVAGAQLILGVATLALRVPVALGVAHQGGAMLLLTAAVVALAMHLQPLTVAKPTSRRNSP